MPGLKAVVPSLDDVAESLKGFYKDREAGGFMLQVDPVGGFSLEDIGGLKNTLSETREKLKKARDRLDAFGDLDPSKARDALTKVCGPSE